MKKHFLTIMLCVIMVFALAACENKEQNSIPTLEAEEMSSVQEIDSSEGIAVEDTEEFSEVIETEKNSEYSEIPQDIKDEVRKMMSTQEELAKTLNHSLNSDPLSQRELNEKSHQLYEVWDFALNSLWNTLKETLSEEEMNALTATEREWIEKKEQAVKEAGAQFEGGTIYPLIVNLKAAELTKARVYELLKLIIPLDTSSYVGEYNDYDVYEPNLEIQKNEDETYTIQFGIYRLAFIEDGVGSVLEDKLVFSATDPGGNPLEGHITLDGEIATVTITSSEWEYFSDIKEYKYYKTSDTPFIYE